MNEDVIGLCPPSKQRIPITVRFMRVFLVGASVKSTLHRYWPASDFMTSWTIKRAGKASGRNVARVPSHSSSDQTSAEANPPEGPTSRLEKSRSINWRFEWNIHKPRVTWILERQYPLDTTRWEWLVHDCLAGWYHKVDSRFDWPIPRFESCLSLES